MTGFMFCRLFIASNTKSASRYMSLCKRKSDVIENVFRAAPNSEGYFCGVFV